MIKPVGGSSSFGLVGSSITVQEYGGTPPATTSGSVTNWLKTIDGRIGSVAKTRFPMPITQWKLLIDTENGSEPVSVRRSVKSKIPSSSARPPSDGGELLSVTPSGMLPSILSRMYGPPAPPLNSIG